MQEDGISEKEPPEYSILGNCKIQVEVSPVSVTNRNKYIYTVICIVDYSTGTISGKWRTGLTLETESFSINPRVILEKVKENVSKETYDMSGFKIK